MKLFHENPIFSNSEIESDKFTVWNIEIISFDFTEKSLLAGDQWWPRTSGGRLRFAHAITHLLRHRFGHFINSNKWNTHKKDWSNFLPGSQKISNFINLPSCKHHCISGGWQPFKHACLNTEINTYKLLYRYFPITKSYKLQPMCK